MKLFRLAVLAAVFSTMCCASIWGQQYMIRPQSAVQPGYAVQPGHATQPGYAVQPNTKFYYVVRPVGYVYNGNLLNQNLYGNAGQMYDLNGQLPHGHDVPPSCGCETKSCDCCCEPACISASFCKLCIPNMLPSIIKDLHCSCGQLIDNLAKCSPSKICLPFLPKLHSTKCGCDSCGCDVGVCGVGGCEAGGCACDHGGEQILHPIPYPEPSYDDNPFQEDPEAPPLPPADARLIPPATLPLQLSRPSGYRVRR